MYQNWYEPHPIITIMPDTKAAIWKNRRFAFIFEKGVVATTDAASVFDEVSGGGSEILNLTETEVSSR
jgi:hypothetical protein